MAKSTAIKLIDDRISIYEGMGTQYMMVVADLRMIREKVENLVKHYTKGEANEEVRRIAADIIEYWKKEVGMQIKAVDKLEQAVSGRLNNYTEQEIKTAVKNRVRFVKNSEFHQREENKKHRNNIYLVLRNDKVLDDYLNLEAKEEARPERVVWE